MRKVLVAAALLVGLAPARAADPLGMGDPAPALALKKFVKGDAVEKLEKGKVYVVEFWATWCGPCIAAFPHLSELQKKHPEATVIGVNVWERGEADAVTEKVTEFVGKQADRMSYRVALDTEPSAGKMATGWLKAAEQDGIPCAFIVNGDGVVAWIGHPMSMDKPLEQILAGKWDIAKAKEEAKKEKAQMAKMRELSAKMRKAQKDPKELLEVIDAALTDSPEMESRLAGLKFQTLVKLGDLDKTLAYGDKLIEVYKDAPMALNNVAWPLVENPGDKPEPKLMKLAVRLAEKADEGLKGKDAAVADTLGTAYFHAGELAKAVKAQERAVKLAGDSKDAAEMKERLEQFKKKLDEKKGG